ncbi:hypothetical protein HDU76_011026 [Blyttiomyces sp. JEL0837]|nr:hypothetical protein HDU76_011026 [Blyttiomyces sp. JEL0837]
MIIPLAVFITAATITTASPINVGYRSTTNARVSYINFYSNWDMFVPNSDMDATDQIIVNYNVDRILPLCNATADMPNTTVTAFYQIRNQTTSVTLLDTHPTTPVSRQDSFQIPPLSGPGDLAMWFSCSSNNTAPKFDSKYGANYHFTVNGAMIHFVNSFSSVVTGSLKSGDPILVQYDIERVNKLCPSDGTHSDLVIDGYYKIDNNPITQFPVYYKSYAFLAGPQRPYTEAVITSAITVPGKLSVWFSCQSNAGSGWDSNFGNNWNFDIVA